MVMMKYLLTGNTKVYSRSNEFILESKDFELDNIHKDSIKGGKDVKSSSKIFMNVLNGKELLNKKMLFAQMLQWLFLYQKKLQ